MHLNKFIDLNYFRNLFSFFANEYFNFSEFKKDIVQKKVKESFGNCVFFEKLNFFQIHNRKHSTEIFRNFQKKIEMFRFCVDIKLSKNFKNSNDK